MKNWIDRRVHRSRDLDKIWRNLAMECGVSHQLWRGAFEPTLEYIVKMSGPVPEQEEQQQYIRLADFMHRRRGYNLPSGIDPEDIHLSKDRWTYVVFMLSAIKCFSEASKITKRQFVGDRHVIQPAEFAAWVHQDSTVKTVVDEVINEQHRCDTSILISGILNEVKVKQPAETLKALEVEDVAVPVEKQNTPIDKPVPAENKRLIGASFFEYIQENKENLAGWAFFDQDGLLNVETPRGYIEYAKGREYSWQAVQKGVKKLRYHVLNGEELFHKLNSKNYMKFHLPNDTP